MPMQWRRDLNFERRVARCGFRGELWEIALQVHAQREEVGEHANLGGAARGECIYGSGKIGLGEFEEGGFSEVDTAALDEFGGDQTHAIVRAFYAGSMRKDDVADFPNHEA